MPHDWALAHEEELMLARDRRLARELQYVILIIAGIASLFVNVSFAASVALKAVGVFLVLGGTIALVGHWRRLLHLEAAGFPLLITAMGALSLSAFAGGTGTVPRYFVGSLCTAFTFALFARFRDLQTLTRLNRAIKDGKR